MMSALRAAMLRHVRFPAARILTPNKQNLGWSRAYHIEHPDPIIEKQIKSTALDIVLNYSHLKSVFRAVSCIEHHPTVKISSDAFGVRVLSCVLDLLKKDPEFDQGLIFCCRKFVHLYSSDGTEDFTTEQVTAKVLLIAKSHPLICPSKLTEEADWERDLGLSWYDCKDIISSLALEFKLVIPTYAGVNLQSVKRSSNYIYNHLGERSHWLDFIKYVCLANGLADDVEGRMLWKLVSALQSRLMNDTKSNSSDSQHVDDDAVVSVATDILHKNPNNKCVITFSTLISEHPKVKHYPEIYVRVFSALLDIIQEDPQVSRKEAFIARSFVLLHSSDGTEDLTKDQVKSKVLDIVNSYRKSCPSKVTEEAYFDKDLGLNSVDISLISHLFQVEFKLLIPENEFSKFVSCKSAIDYIYNHLNQRLPKPEFERETRRLQNF